MAPAKAGEHVYHLFVVRTRPEHREAIQKSLSEAGISTGIHYPVPLHLQPAYSQAGYKKGVFPVTERLANEVLSLPMYAELPDATAERIAHALASSAARS
jgi:dTDP-4-amino-4,6-dideoxygalactose transaminase